MVCTPERAPWAGVPGVHFSTRNDRTRRAVAPRTTMADTQPDLAVSSAPARTSDTAGAPCIGRPSKADADKARGKTWCCTLSSRHGASRRTLELAGRVVKIKFNGNVHRHQMAQRYAMQLSPPDGLQAFFVFVDPKRREQLERELI